jgi:hypothetical protein
MSSPTSELVRQYGGVVKAAKATGIPRTTLQSRLEQEQVRQNRPAPTIVPLAVPKQPKIAKLRDGISDLKHLIIPDTQCRPGVPLDHLRWAGLYACAKKPTSIINLGDHWDMPSLCSYDKGKRAAENMRYSNDIKAGNKGMELFMEPILEEMARHPDWNPRLVFTRGNHEARIERATQDHPELEDTLGYGALDLDCYGWEQFEFLDIADIDGVCYSHYFKPSPTSKFPVTTARALLTKKHVSCIMGHVQKYEVAMDYDARGKRITALFAGCFYQHEDDYRDPQATRATWRGVHILYGVRDGEFTHNSIDLTYLRDRFGR